MTSPREKLFIWLWIVIGLGLHFFGAKSSPGTFRSLLAVSGFVTLLAACALYAQNKGYSRNFGLLAIFSIFGVIVLLCLPRRNQH